MLNNTLKGKKWGVKYEKQNSPQTFQMEHMDTVEENWTTDQMWYFGWNRLKVFQTSPPFFRTSGG